MASTVNQLSLGHVIAMLKTLQAATALKMKSKIPKKTLYSWAHPAACPRSPLPGRLESPSSPGPTWFFLVSGATSFPTPHPFTAKQCLLKDSLPDLSYIGPLVHSTCHFTLVAQILRSDFLFNVSLHMNLFATWGQEFCCSCCSL